MAAQLWAGPGAALSHLTAAAIWRLRDTRPAVIDVVTNRNVRAAGVRVHRATVAHNDVARSGAFTVTSADRTLIDLASVLNEARLESCLEEALHQRLLDPADLRIRLSSCGSRGRRGAGTLRQLLDMRGPDCAPTESDLETLLLRVLRKARLPAPQRQYEVWNGHEFVARLDFAYPDAHLAIQADSYRWHSRRRAWEKDIHQRNKLQVLGWRLRPTTYGELKYRPELFAKDVAYLLRARHPLGL
jgi:hypothetical protein